MALTKLVCWIGALFEKRRTVDAPFFGRRVGSNFRGVGWLFLMMGAFVGDSAVVVRLFLATLMGIVGLSQGLGTVLLLRHVWRRTPFARNELRNITLLCGLPSLLLLVSLVFMAEGIILGVPAIIQILLALATNGVLKGPQKVS